MKQNSIVIAAPRSGSGKTVITCALLKALSLRGKKVSAFKCGPDYIDPMFHTKILDVPSKNLDLFFTSEEKTREIFVEEENEIAVIEGVMGLYDGLGGICEEASTYHVAKILKAPIILVLDAYGAGRSVLAQIKGFLEYDEEKLIQGIILNRVSKSFYQNLKVLIEKELPIKVLGFYEKQEDLHIESRHLGLKLPDEIDSLKETMNKAAKKLEQTVEVDKIIELSSKAGELSCSKKKIHLSKKQRPRIAVAMDEAFCFYYKDNLRLLEEYGGELVFFSPIHDEHLPENIQGLVLGGGYPELHAKELMDNISMRKDIKRAIDRGITSLAECGGFMYLHENLITPDGTFEMVGAVKGNCHYKGKLVHFGYVTVEEKTGKFGMNKNPVKIRGHEFHYYDSSNNGKDAVCTKPVTGKSWEGGHIGEKHWWGFAHLYYPSNEDFVAAYIENSLIENKSEMC